MVMNDAPEHTSHRWSGVGNGHCNLGHSENIPQEKHELYEHLREDKALKEGQIIPPRRWPTASANLEVIMTNTSFGMSEHPCDPPGIMVTTTSVSKGTQSVGVSI